MVKVCQRKCSLNSEKVCTGCGRTIEEIIEAGNQRRQQKRYESTTHSTTQLTIK